MKRIRTIAAIAALASTVAVPTANAALHVRAKAAAHPLRLVHARVHPDPMCPNCSGQY